MNRARKTARRSDPAVARPDARPGRPEDAPSLLPPASAWAQWQEPYLIPALLVLITRALAWVSLPLASEDAYITFRYSRNLASGNGLIYNPGERVMGFTSPLWAVWNALGIAVVHDPVLWSRATGVVADLVTLVVLVRLLERHGSRAAAWCFAGFFALWPFFSAVTVSGLESPLLLGLIVLGAALAARGSVWTGPVLGALALTRPEGVFCAAVIAVWARWRDRAVALAIAAAGAAALWAYYGSPVPQSLIAKSKLYGTPGPWAGHLWWDWILPLRVGNWPDAGDLNMLMPLVVVLAAGVALGLKPLWTVRRSGLAAAVAGMVVVWAGYSALGVAYFYWYFLVPLAAAAVIAAVGLPRATRSRAVYASAILYILGAWTIARILYVGRAQNEAYDFDRVASFLSERARAGQSVMLEPIGLVGYRNPLTVIDEIGLVSPAVARRRLQGSGWYTDLVSERKPEWLVVRRNVLAKGTAFAGTGAPFRDSGERDSLLARYQVVDPGNDASGGNALTILRRAR